MACNLTSWCWTANCRRTLQASFRRCLPPTWNEGALELPELHHLPLPTWWLRFQPREPGVFPSLAEIILRHISKLMFWFSLRFCISGFFDCTRHNTWCVRFRRSFRRNKYLSLGCHWRTLPWRWARRVWNLFKIYKRRLGFKWELFGSSRDWLPRICSHCTL